MSHPLDDGLPLDGPPHAASAWAELEDHAESKLPHLRDLFAGDPSRDVRMGFECADLWIDLSHQNLTYKTMGFLVDLATQRRVVGTLMNTLIGDTVNSTEDRPAIHGALRGRRGTAPGHDEVEAGHATFDRMTTLASEIRNGEARGATGRTVEAVVHLGMGGSHLGPALAVDALGHLAYPGVEVRFSSGVDPDDLDEALAGLDPETTLVVACSKSFTTVETLTALDTAMAWLSNGVGEAAIDHVIGVTAEPERARSLGLPEERILEVPLGVGGRFSLGSAVGFPVMVAIGPEAFHEMLKGMHLVDVLSAAEPPEENAAVQLALVDVWNRCFLGRGSLAIVPYAHRLRILPAHVQQISMESLGKGVCQNSDDPETATGPVVWGAPGTDAQHAFFQLLHQGTDVVPVDLIAVARPLTDDDRSVHGQDLLVANLIAQADALAFGRTPDEVRTEGVPEDLVAHQMFPGNRPSTTILMPELSPSTLGQLIALYENRTIAMAALLGLNPFDQWGVELGKELATRIGDGLTNRDGAQNPSATE
ncbi:MAG: glucose-6-phosphate isomerase, partial [Actinomycetota bacterium]|nr:glucose-6-phosphate isomerase [Actinomycetota bacterium]